VRDARQAADVLRRGRRADLSALADAAHAEWPVVSEALLGHLDVTLLEQAQRQQPVRKQHRLQRE